MDRWQNASGWPGTRQCTAQDCENVLAQAARAQVINSARLGIPADRAEAAARAAVRPLPDGEWQTLPERVDALEIHDELHRLGALGVTTWLGGVDCPLLLVRAVRRLPPAPGMEWFGEFSARFARGVPDELAALSRTRPTVSVARIDATHAMNLETPEAVATLVAEFVRGLSDCMIRHSSRTPSSPGFAPLECGLEEAPLRCVPEVDELRERGEDKTGNTSRPPGVVVPSASRNEVEPMPRCGVVFSSPVVERAGQSGGGAGALCRVTAHSTSPRQLNAAPSTHTAPQPATV